MATLGNKVVLGVELEIKQEQELKKVFKGRKISMSAILREFIRRGVASLENNAEILKFMRSAMVNDVEDKLQYGADRRPVGEMSITS